MNVKITETGETKTLNIIDEQTGTDWTADLIGNAGALNDGQFDWDEEQNAYLATQGTYDWWKKYIDGAKATEHESNDLADELGLSRIDVRYEVQDAIGGLDYDQHRSAAECVLRDIYIKNVAQLIYREFFGHIDDEDFAETKTEEISDWLTDGDVDIRKSWMTVADEWAEYDAAEIARNK